MAYIEILDDIINEIADKLGIYEGKYSIDDKSILHPNDCDCRMCFEIDIRERIENAIKNEKLLQNEI